MLKVPSGPPKSIEQLLNRAEALAGFSLGELANVAKIKVPDNFRREKGWTGQLIELFLGAQAGSRPTQDFPELGVELKTLPINASGQPLETTYVCYAPLTDVSGITWENSNVRNKLNCVLWVPVQGERDIPPSQRHIGTAILWQPNDQQLLVLKQDWEELMELIVLGNIEHVTARHGEMLQLRPKAANGSVVTDAIGPNGSIIKTRPRGFYLRKQFTQQVIEQAFGLEP